MYRKGPYYLYVQNPGDPSVETQIWADQQREYQQQREREQFAELIREVTAKQFAYRNWGATED